MELSDSLPADMRTRLEDFGRSATDILASSFATVFEAKAPPLVYHYTNDLGLRGILEHGNFWLTNVFKLNDPSEIAHGYSRATNAILKTVCDDKPERGVFAKEIERFGIDGGLQAAAHFFSCSFSSRGDDLGQWRAYADNGRGFALGFDGPALETAFTEKDGVKIENNSTFPVTYDDQKLNEIQSKLVELILPLISLPRGRGLSSDQIKKYMMALSVVFSVHAVRASLFFKHEAYLNEEEFRFFEVHRRDIAPPNVKLRTGPYSLIDYREFNWRRDAPNALRRIVVGPAGDWEKAKLFANECVRAFGLDAVEVVRSLIPYRVG